MYYYSTTNTNFRGVLSSERVTLGKLVCGFSVSSVRIPLSSEALIFGGVAERLNAAVLKTVDLQRSGGSNPSPSAISYFVN